WYLATGQWAQKASRYAEVQPYFSGGTGVPSYSPPSHKQAFTQVGTVYAAAHRRSMDSASVPLVLYQRQKNGALTELPDAHPAVKLFQSVNPREGKTAFWYRHHISKCLLGETFTLLDYASQSPSRSGSVPKALWVLRGECTNIVVDGTTIQAYRYGDRFGQTTIYKPEEIWHSKFPNPCDDWRGLAPLSPAQMYAALEQSTAKSWWRFFKNGARTGLVMFTDRVLKTETVRQLLQEYDQNYAGEENQHRAFVAHGGVKIMPPPQDKKD